MKRLNRKRRRVRCPLDNHICFQKKDDAREALGRLYQRTGTSQVSVFVCPAGNIHIGHTPRHLREKYKLQ